MGDEKFEDLRHMEQSSCAIVIMSLPKSAFTKPLQGTGFVITRSTETPLTACTYISSKWPQTTPQDKVVLRVFLGKPTDSTVDTHSEEELCELAAFRNTKYIEVYRKSRMDRSGTVTKKYAPI